MVQLSNEQNKQMANAYTKSTTIPSAVLTQPIPKYTNDDFVKDHSRPLYIVIAIGIATCLYLTQYQTNEPPLFIESG